MDTILTTTNLTKCYNPKYALNNLTMSVNRGEIYGLVGLNGSGKTTLFRIISGLSKQTSGDFSLFGIDSKAGISAAYKKISSLIEPSIYQNMSAADNLKAHSMLLNVKADIPAILNFVGLDAKLPQLTKDYSMGMKQRLGIGLALCGNPELLILDEPINGLDPEGIILIRSILQKLSKEKGLTVIISSHILSELEKLATAYGFIHKGKILQSLSSHDLEIACGKVAIMEVSNVAGALAVLPQAKMLDQNRIEIAGEINFSQVALLLSENDIVISNVTSETKNLESFFMNLIGGGK